jgi:valyl-tRNA synthetase
VRQFVEHQSHHLENLAGLSHIDYVPELGPGGLRVRGVTRLAEFSLILDDAIDMDAEKQRLHREKERVLREIEGLGRRLKNHDFLAKAPAEVVAKTRRRYEAMLSTLRKVEESLGRLQSAQAGSRIDSDVN